MRTRVFLASLVICFPLVAAQATDDRKSDQPKPDAKKIESKKDYAEFSALIHKMVIKEVPRYYEDQSGWGPTIPIPDKLRFPRLQRVKVKVGDREELPHGLWKRFKVKMEDPNKDLKIQVRELTKVDAAKFRLVVDSEAAVVGEGEVRHWQKGLSLLGLTAQADAVFGMSMVFDVGISLDTKKFPPDLVVEPKVTDLKLDLKEFNLRRVGNIVGNIVEIEGEQAKNLGNELKDVLKSLVKSQEAEVKNLANEAIAKSLKEGKGNISAAALLKVTTPAKAKEKD